MEVILWKGMPCLETYLEIIFRKFIQYYHVVLNVLKWFKSHSLKDIFNFGCHTGKNGASIADVATLVFVAKVLCVCVKRHFHDTKFICPAENLVFFDKCAAISFRYLEGKVFGWLFRKNKFMFDNSCNISMALNFNFHVFYRAGRSIFHRQSPCFPNIRILPALLLKSLNIFFFPHF